MRRHLQLLCALLVMVVAAVTLSATLGPIGPLMNLRGKSDNNGNLMVAAGTPGGTTGPLLPLSTIGARTDNNGNLMVNCTGCAAAPGGSSGDVLCNISATVAPCDTAKFTYATGVITLVNGSNTTSMGTDSGGGIDFNVSGSLEAYIGGNGIQSTAGGWVQGGYFVAAGNSIAVANVGANSCGTTTATVAGSESAFEITVGATAGTQCRITFNHTASNKWQCAANDETTAIALRVNPVDTTHTDFLGALIAGDKISAVCFDR